jgi:hypothetical protein
MSDASIKVRFVKFVEKVHVVDKVEIKEGWIITTDKFTSVETLWKIMIRDGILKIMPFIS